MIRKAFVILEIDYDNHEADNPKSWDWRDLLDLTPQERVWANVFDNENDMFEAVWMRGIRKGF